VFKLPSGMVGIKHNTRCLRRTLGSLRLGHTCAQKGIKPKTQRAMRGLVSELLGPVAVPCQKANRQNNYEAPQQHK
jgi:hypothetical protein